MMQFSSSIIADFYHYLRNYDYVDYNRITGNQVFLMLFVFYLSQASNSIVEIKAISLEKNATTI